MLAHKVEVKRDIYEDNELVLVTLEEIEGLLYVHVDVKQFSKVVVEYLQALWDQIQMDAWYSGYDDIFSYTKNSKFVKLIDKDFVYVADVIGTPDIKLYRKTLPEM